MKLERVGKRKVLIIISQDELKSLKETFKSKAQNTLSFEIVQQFSKFAKKEKDLFELKNKATIEMLPQNGSYVIFITLSFDNAAPHNRKIYKIKGITEPVIFKFQTVDDLILAVNSLNKYQHKILKCHLIEKNSKYFFILYPHGSLFEKIRFVMCEYGHSVGKGEFLCAALKEQGNVLIENDALQTLNKYFK